MSNKITVEEANRLIKNRVALYYAMENISWFLPRLSSTIVTSDWLMGVRSGKYMCPKYEEIKLRPCINKPPLDLVIKELIQTIDPNKDFGFDDTHKPDLLWSLRCLSSLNPNHRFFQKNYHPKEEQVEWCDNDDGLFDNNFRSGKIPKGKKSAGIFKKRKNYYEQIPNIFEKKDADGYDKKGVQANNQVKILKDKLEQSVEQRLNQRKKLNKDAKRN